MSRNPRSGTVSRSGVAKIRRALAAGWRPGLRVGPGEFLRLRRRRRATS